MADKERFDENEQREETAPSLDSFNDDLRDEDGYVVPEKRKYRFRLTKRRLSPKIYEVGFLPVMATFAACFALAVAAFFIGKEPGIAEAKGVPFYLIHAAFPVAVYLLPALVYLFTRPKPRGGVLALRRFSLADARFILMSGLLLTALQALGRFMLVFFFSKADAGALSLRNVSNVPAAILVFVLLPAFCEEVFFRGVMLSALSGAAGGFAGIVVSSIAFALCKCDLAAFPLWFVCGLLLGLCAHVCSSCLPAIVLRAVLTVMTMLFSERLDFVASERVGNVFLIIVLAAVVFLIFIFFAQSLENLCSKKAVSVSLLNAKENGEGNGEDAEPPVVFYAKPFRLSSETGYTFHKFFRVLFSPAIVIAAAVFFFITIR